MPLCTSFHKPDVGYLCCLGLVVSVLLFQSTEPLGAATVTIDGSQTYQLIDGFGVNANHRNWANNELQPVLDALIDQAGMTLFRVLYDRTDWEAVNDNTDPHVMDWGYYNTVYSSADFEAMWGMVGYLNQRGITNGVVFNFQGTGPSWMMSGRFLSPGYEDEWAEMIGSLLVYARNTRHLQFSSVAPGNEPDNTSDARNQGILMGQSPYVTALHKLAQRLDSNGLSDVRFVAPDLAASSTDWLTAMMNDSLVMGKLAHFGLHSYQDSGGGSTGIYDFLQQSAYPGRNFWMAEFNVWCGSCESCVGGDDSWAFARGTASSPLKNRPFPRNAAENVCYGPLGMLPASPTTSPSPGSARFV